MSPTIIGILAVAGIILTLFLIIWPLRQHLKKNPKATIVLTMAALIFIITTFTIVKTYGDYKDFLANIASHEIIISNIVFALFLDFSILMIGGLFLYLANQLYTSDFINAESKKPLTNPSKEEQSPAASPKES
jgi:glucan phosphoethanolaminetransferase (alkaline phosphatase superfamily)